MKQVEITYPRPPPPKKKASGQHSDWFILSLCTATQFYLGGLPENTLQDNSRKPLHINLKHMQMFRIRS